VSALKRDQIVQFRPAEAGIGASAAKVDRVVGRITAVD
jgi:hypothetical protein